MRIYFFFILFFLTTSMFGQDHFERGYFIDNNNRETKCLIKNKDWRNNPTGFTYKLNNTDSIRKGTITYVKEFGIYGISEFMRADVLIDRSSDKAEELSSKSDPIWSQEQLFLKVLIKGKASLYFYLEDNFERFFYSINNSSIDQLIHKSYLRDASKITQNNQFYSQLWTNVNCSKTDISSIRDIRYSKSDFEKYFVNYNKCVGDTSVVFGSKTKRNLVHLKITPGFNYTSLSAKNDILSINNSSLGGNISFRIGTEIEYLLPFNNNKWGIIIEPSYQYFNSKNETGTLTGKVNYSSIDFACGLRRYFFLNNQLSMFLDGNFNLSFNSKDIANLDNFYPTMDSHSHFSLDISNRCFNYAIGGGIRYKRISVEGRFYTSKNIFDLYKSWSTNHPTLAFIVGYRIL